MASSAGVTLCPDNRVLLGLFQHHPVSLPKDPGHHSSYTPQICMFSSSLLFFNIIFAHFLSCSRPKFDFYCFFILSHCSRVNKFGICVLTESENTICMEGG